MHFSTTAAIALFATLGAVTLAEPIPTTKTVAAHKLELMQAAGCDVGKCAAALAPTVIGCAAAAAQDFLDPITDAACIAAAVNAKVNPPAACAGCFGSAPKPSPTPRAVPLGAVPRGDF